MALSVTARMGRLSLYLELGEWTQVISFYFIESEKPLEKFSKKNLFKRAKNEDL